MAEMNAPYAPSLDMSVDLGLRKFMLGVYNKMALGLVVTAALSWAVAFYPPVSDYFLVHSPDGALAGVTALGMITRFAPLVLLLGASFMRNTIPGMAAFVYWAVVVCMGISGAVYFSIYNLGSITQVFLITAASFGALSLYGYTTKRDLGPIGSFLIMALFGLIIASIVSIFFPNGLISLIIAVVGVVIFAGLTAYDTQKLKSTYYALGGNAQALNVATSYGALSLYLDFINLFFLLLRLMGSRR